MAIANILAPRLVAMGADTSVVYLTLFENAGGPAQESSRAWNCVPLSSVPHEFAVQYSEISLYRAVRRDRKDAIDGILAIWSLLMISCLERGRRKKDSFLYSLRVCFIL